MVGDLHRLPAALLLATAALDGAACSAGTAPSEAGRAAEGARAALARADELRLGLRSVPAERRAAQRAAAIEAYRAILREHPREHAVVAEAAVRAARLVADEGRLDEALLLYELAAKRGADSGWRSRALLEAAHELRRAGLDERAEAAYLLAAGAAQVVGGDRDEALDWAARLAAKRGAVVAAREAWRRLVRDSADPLRRIEAWDRLASQWLDGGDIEAAAGELHAARVAFAACFDAQDELSRRIVDALEGMRALRRAERMVEARWRSSKQ